METLPQTHPAHPELSLEPAFPEFQIPRATHGLYDPTLHHDLVALGYDRPFDEMSENVEVPMGGAQVGRGRGAREGWQQITLDRSTRKVTLPAGVALDFGGIAKGMAVDAAIAGLSQCGVEAAMVNAGGDLAVLGRPERQDSWPLTVAGQGRNYLLSLRRGCLATSGIARRHWRQDHQPRHHLLDPRTGLPAETGLWSVTVAAGRCEQADVAAKVAFLLGPARGAAFLSDHGLSGLLIDRKGLSLPVGHWPLLNGGVG